MNKQQKRIEEAMKIVDELNELYYDQTGDEERVPFCFKYAWTWMGISYFDEVVWDNMDNDVIEDDDTGKNESIMEHVKKNVRKVRETWDKFII